MPRGPIGTVLFLSSAWTSTFSSTGAIFPGEITHLVNPSSQYHLGPVLFLSLLEYFQDGFTAEVLDGCGFWCFLYCTRMHGY